MRRSFLSCCIALSLTAIVQAQVHIQPTVPAAGLIQKNQLWNLVIINGGTVTINGSLRLVIQNRMDGLELFSATTSSFDLPKGSRAVTASVLNPILYNYSGAGSGVGANDLLPIGSYTACYAFSRSNGENGEQLAEECISFDIEPLSPPLLIFPTDSSILKANPTQFTWTPPVPANLFNQLNYDLLIVEIIPGQQPVEAVQENIPFYSSAQLYNNFLNYPAALPAFEKGKWYAWQVIAKDRASYAAKTETWVFNVTKDSIVPESTVLSFVQLDDNGNGGLHYLNARNLSLKYYSGDKEHENLIRILDAQGKLIQQIKQKIVSGDNYMNLELSKSISPGLVYRVELTDNQQRKHVAQFTINN